ncbi:MAG TPA: hypothetical protein VMF50_10235 [Candidatus Binataceae bacterium]|nr:hypothetical protein [Candidatus Binataceae bacterium]
MPVRHSLDLTEAMAAQLWKMPPLVKIYEALGAIGDSRVHLADPSYATVISSSGDKTYTVELDSAARQISSNDNASYWQGYLGYPAIAVLLLHGLYSPRPETLTALAGVPWKELNTRFRNDYARTLDDVLARAVAHGADPAEIRAEAAAILEALRAYGARRGKRLRPPSPSRPI